VTVESSQPTPQPAQNVQPQPSTNNQAVRIAALVIVGLILVAVVGWLVFGKDDGKKKKKQNLTTAIGPNAWHVERLRAEALTLAHPFYWAGPRKGVRYEFWRTTDDQIFVRYLPKGKHAGDPGKYLIISTYRVPGAYKALQKSGGKPGPNGSLIWVRPKSPTNVLIAWPRVPYEVEVYAPKQVDAAKVAQSGNVTTVS
jgi:hypothetical protein